MPNPVKLAGNTEQIKWVPSQSRRRVCGTREGPRAPGALRFASLCIACFSPERGAKPGFAARFTMQTRTLPARRDNNFNFFSPSRGGTPGTSHRPVGPRQPFIASECPASTSVPTQGKRALPKPRRAALYRVVPHLFSAQARAAPAACVRNSLSPFRRYNEPEVILRGRIGFDRAS